MRHGNNICRKCGEWKEKVLLQKCVGRMRDGRLTSSVVSCRAGLWADECVKVGSKKRYSEDYFDVNGLI